MFDFVVGGEKTGQWYRFACVWRTILLVHPDSVALYVVGRDVFNVLVVRDSLLDVLDVLRNIFFLLPNALFVDAQELLLGGRIGAHVFYVFFVCVKLFQQKLDTKIGVFVLAVSSENPGPFLGCVFKVASHFQMDFVNRLTFFLKFSP